MDNKGNDKHEERTQMQALGFVTGIGINFAAIIAVCLFAGRYYDQNFGSGSTGTLIGIILGFITAIWSTYKKIVGK